MSPEQLLQKKLVIIFSGAPSRDLSPVHSLHQNVSPTSLGAPSRDLRFVQEEQSKYPLGQCVRKDLHKLFHSLYGQYYNTVDQWEQFKEDYRNGVYNDIINKQSA